MIQSATTANNKTAAGDAAVGDRGIQMYPASFDG